MIFDVHEWLRIRNSVEEAYGVADLTAEQRALLGYITKGDDE
jgi:hypothetical protein